MGLNKTVRHSFAALRGDGAAEDVQESEFDLRSLLLVTWHAKWLVAVCFLFGIGYSYVKLSQITPVYTAETRVLWEVDQTKYVDIDPVASSIGRDFYALASQIEVLTSGKLLARVVRDLDLAHDPVFTGSALPPPGWMRWLSPSTIISEARAFVRSNLSQTEPARVSEETPEEANKRLIDMVRGTIGAEWLDGTYILIIRATTVDPQLSAKLANELARLYILDQLETKFEATREATDWLTDRVAELKVALEDAEQAVEDFVSGSTLISEDSLALAARQLKDLRDRAVTLDSEAREAEARLKAAEAARAKDNFAAVASLMREPRLTAMVDQMGQPDAQIQGQAMVARFDAEYERAKIRAAAAIQRLDGQAASVRDSLTAMEAKQDKDTTALVQLRQLKREAEASRLIYEFFLARLKETSVQQGIQRPDARVLTEAEAPVSPSAPNREATLAMGGGGGVLLAVILAILFERMNNTFRSSEELERRSGQPVIGSIPMAPFSRRRTLLKYLIEKPTSGFAEAIRNLRTSVLLANVDDPPQVIMVTSSLPSEGKTTCCIALAQISRAMGKKVLVLECDIRRRTFRDFFDLPERGGILSVLSGAGTAEELIVHDEGSGLDILPGEQSSVNAADIFASHRFADFIVEMRRHYDFILVDTPPVLAVPDARVIGKISDAAIFCVRWNKTSRSNVIEALRFFRQINIKVAGLVLSQINVNKMARYGYANYSYYKQASRYYHN